MKTIPVHSTKYDGSLHYRYPSTLVREEGDLLLLYMRPGTAIESYRGAQVASNHTLQLYWSDRPYNLHVSWYADWCPRNHYVNIATPATWHDGSLRFVDLDLDVIWRSSTGEIILDDEDEFADHQVRFGYPPDLVERAIRSGAEVRDLIARRVYPFDGSLHGWRPDAAS
jgi:uncharacterized protein